MSVSRTKNLTKTFNDGGFIPYVDSGDDSVAIKSRNLSIEEGEIFGFLCPTGGEKSPTINILFDYVWSTEGQAEISDIDAPKRPAEVET